MATGACGTRSVSMTCSAPEGQSPRRCHTFRSPEAAEADACARSKATIYIIWGHILCSIPQEI